MVLLDVFFLIVELNDPWIITELMPLGSLNQFIVNHRVCSPNHDVLILQSVDVCFYSSLLFLLIIFYASRFHISDPGERNDEW